MSMSVGQIRELFDVRVLRQRVGEAAIGSPLCPSSLLAELLAAERAPVQLTVRIAFRGMGKRAFRRDQFSLEDSEGYLVDPLPTPGPLEVRLRSNEQVDGEFLFGIYADLLPARLWFDTGIAFDESDEPLMIEVPLDGAPSVGSAGWQEAVAVDLDRQLEQGAEPQVETETVLERLTHRLGIPYRKLSNGFMFRVGLARGRRQHVLMTYSGKDDDGDDLLRFVTICAPADDNRESHLQFLRTNPRLSYGGLGICEVGGRNFYVITNTQLVATADHEELLKSILYLARRGDELEAQLTGGQDLR